jgi:hypothetical protein
MLAEFMLTPDALLAGFSREGRDAIDELKACFLPGRTVPVALLSKLGDEWVNAAARKIARLNSAHRHKAMAVFQQLLSDASLSRPGVRVQIEDENGWIQAARSSNSQVTFERIVVSPSATPPMGNGLALTDFVSDGFWEGYENPRVVARDLASQEPALKCICAHSEWMIIRMPQISGSSGDELATVKQIIRLSNRLPAGFHNSAIDLHVCLQRGISEQKLIDGVSAELADHVRQGVTIQLSLWPHFINRELIAGDLSRTSSGEQFRRPLWYITMAHVAVGRREANDTESGNTWSLLARRRAFARYEDLRAATPLQALMLK